MARQPYKETIMTDTPLPPVADRAVFEADLDALRVREKAHTREGDALLAPPKRPGMMHPTTR
jgi:hypothetical protein